MVSRKNRFAIQQFSLPITDGEEPEDAEEQRRATNLVTTQTNDKKTVVLSSPIFFRRLSLPKPTKVFASYWKFAKARQDVFFARLKGDEVPSPDPVIKLHRFTNAYRASDRVSQYLIRRVLYDSSWSAVDLIFRLLIFKFFNKIETWEAISETVGTVTWENYDFANFDECLSRNMAAGKKIYSAAYIMPSGRTAYGHKRKHRNHLKVIETMISARVPERLTECKTLEAVFILLRQFPCIGPFIGYQFAIDLNYSTLVNFSENEFVEPGPGALDGIAKCFSNLGDLAPADIIRYMTDIQERAFEEHAPGFQTLWGRPLHLIDCQNLFCEISKYARARHPEFEGLSNRTRIKQLYRPSSRAIDRPWFPPKWGINDLIAPDCMIP